MTIDRQRPDLSRVDPEVQAYIESLEAELEALRSSPDTTQATEPSATPAQPGEPPTTMSVITVSASGVAKRTPRHLYQRQRRGGMGVFDLETAEHDPPALLTLADERDVLLVVTNRGRAFHLPVAALDESPIRSAGQALSSLVALDPGERSIVVTPRELSGQIALLSARGTVRALRYNIVGDNMRPGVQLLDTDRFGEVVAGCWTPGEGDLFIATRQAAAIRFAVKKVDLSGSLAIRLNSGDLPVAVTAVTEGSGVFLLGADGKGTVRLMSGFRANKALGGGGKLAMKSDRLVGAVTITDRDDIFIISELSKIIRFPASEVPATEHVVQGVNCMSLRRDTCRAITSAQPSPTSAVG